MNREIDTKKWDNIFFLKVFLAGVVILILVSLIVRIMFLISNSSFTTSTFTLLILGKDTYIAKVDRNIGELDLLTIHNQRSKFLKNSRLVNSILLGVPLDGEIIQNNTDAYTQLSINYFSFGSMAQIMVHQGQYSFMGMNIYDLFKIYTASKSVSNTSINQQTVSDMHPDDPLLFTYFKNEEVLNGKMSVEVVNGTNTHGLAGRVAQMLENGGYNVVSIISTDDTPHTKIIYRISPNSSLRSLIHLFSAPTQYKNESYIADVSIILGEDLANKIPQ